MTYADESAALAALNSGTAIPADLRQIVMAYPNLRPAVAAYPGTDEAMLGWLRDLHDPGVDAQLAARPGPVAPAPAPAPAAPATPVVAAPTPSPAPVGGDGPGRFVPPAGPSAQPAPVAPQPMPQPAPSRPASGAPTAAMPGGPVPPGGPVAAGPPGPPAFTPTPPASSGGGGMRIAIIAVIALVVVGGGVFGAFAAGLVPGFGTSPATLAPPSPDGEQPSQEPSAITPTPIEPSPITPTPILPTPTIPPPVGFACWDAGEADSLAACPTPQSREQAWQYLRYVYPSLARHDSCKQSDSTGKSDYQGVTVMWECELGDSLLRYRYWVDPADAERHYGRKFSDSTAETYDVAIGGQAVEGWVKTSVEAIAKQSDGSKRYVATMWLPGLQLSMSAEGNDTTAMWNAFELVRIRPLEQVNGHQLGSNPSEVPLTIAER